jgi:poly-gamma-glutamate synthesis protein (capsule biosynthesis protein)
MLEVKSHHKKFLVILSIIILLILICVIIVCFFAPKTSAPTVNGQDINTKTKVSVQSISSNVLFFGNIYWGRYINDWSMASDLKYAYPFSRLSEFNRSSYNAWISGLECPTVAGVHISSAEEDSTLTFNCSPDYLPEAAKWFTAFTLANNHTDNQGDAGFKETRQHLDENNIQYFGHYDYQNVDDVCEVIILPVTIAKSDSSTKSGKLPIALCGYNGVFGIPVDEAVAEISNYSPYMTVIAMPHSGAEYKIAPDQLKTNFFRSLIDAGADMVLGDHAHTIQTSESYKGHLIVYSMGNFIFDQQSNEEVTRSAGIRVIMTTTDQDADLLDKWLAVGETCLTFKDDCLQQIKSQNLAKLDISYKFGVVGTNDADKIVKPASAEQQASILERLDWKNTINNLKAPYGGM